MAIETATTLANFLQKVYSKDMGVFFSSLNCDLLKYLKKSTDLIPAGLGSGFTFPQLLASGQSLGMSADGAAIAAAGTPDIQQASVSLSNLDSTFDVSWMLEKVSAGSGSWKPAIAFKMKEVLDDHSKHINRLVAGTHGTGRLGQVNATVTATTFVLKLPVGSILLRRKMKVDSYDTDTSGSVQNSNKEITKLVDATRTATTASLTWTANHGLYITGSYGNAPNGLAGMVDDGTNLTSLHGLSRSTYEEMKSIVSANSGTPRDITEELLQRVAADIFQASGEYPNLVAWNSGIQERYNTLKRGDVRISTATGVGGADTGFKSGATLIMGDKEAPIKVFQDIQPRSAYLLNTEYLERVGDEAPDWVSVGGQTLFPGVSTTYTKSKTGSLSSFFNFAQRRANASGRIDDLVDVQFCGAARGGTDA